MTEYEVIITSDRTMMSNHHGKEFLGFLATGPAINMPEKVWMWLAAPKLGVDEFGRPKEAPYGLRKVEAKLVDEGFKAAIIDPDYIHKYLKSMKVLMVGHHDFFAYGPPSIGWWVITGKEPVNRLSLMRFMRSEVVRKVKERGVKIIVGGPGAWQWLWELDFWRECGVDLVIEGEVERVIGDVVRKALNGEELPDYMYVGPSDTPSVGEIPVIKGGSVNGLVEIMRGCPRGCKFCSVTLRPLRFIPLDKICEEIKVNLRAGVRSVILHSEDVLLYGADGIRPKPDPLIKLHSVVRSLVKDGNIAWSHVSLSALKYAEEEYKLVSNIVNNYIRVNKQVFIGVEVGIETGSSRLAKIIMPAKAAPYPVEIWPDVVEDAFRIMHENYIIPAATLILGLPGEESDDVVKTAELLDRLRPYRSIIVPMFFVPLGTLKYKDWFRKHNIGREHIDVMLKTFYHTVYWAEEILEKFYLREPYLVPVKLGLKLFIQYVKWRMSKLKPEIEAIIRA